MAASVAGRCSTEVRWRGRCAVYWTAHLRGVCGGRQAGRRRSSRLISASAISAMTAMMTMPGEDAVRVEVVLRGADQQAQPLVGAEDLADDRADEGEAEADVQAGEDPGERGRQHDVPGDLPLDAPRIRALAMRLRSTSRAPWKALKKTAKNTSTTASDHLRLDAEAEARR